jgi:hypothetical protein
VYKHVYLEDGLDCPKYVETNINNILLYILYYIVYLLAAWSRVLLEKLTVSQLVKKFSHFMETKVSLQHSQLPATCPYPEPIPVDQSTSEAPVYIS